MSRKHKTELDVDPTSAAEEEEAEKQPAAEAEEEEDDEGGPKVNKAKRNFIIGVGAGIILIIAALSTALYYVLKEEPEPVIEEVVEEKKPEPVQKEPLKYKKTINMKLEPFIIPFEENGNRHFWRIAFSLQLSTKQVVNEIEENIAFVREAIYIFLKTHDRHEFLSRNKKVRDQTFFDLRVLIDRSLQSGRIEAIQVIEFNVL